MDENNSDILKQKKKIDKLDNNNKIIDQEKNETVFYIVQGPGIPFGFNILSFFDFEHITHTYRKCFCFIRFKFTIYERYYRYGIRTWLI